MVSCVLLLMKRILGVGGAVVIYMCTHTRSTPNQPAVLASLLQLYLLTFHPSNPSMVIFFWAFAEAVFSSLVNLMNYC